MTAVMAGATNNAALICRSRGGPVARPTEAGPINARPVGKETPRPIRVAFFRRLPNSYGQDFNVILTEITVDGDCRQQAIDDAIVAFEKQHSVCNWTVLADGYRIDG